MGREKTIQIILVCAVVLLLVMNIFQFTANSGKDEGVKQEDVPVQIADIKGDDWETLIGETVSVEGYYVENHGTGMLIADPALIQIRRPMNASEFIRIDVPLPDDSIQMGKYIIKGKVLEAVDVNEKIYLEKEKYSLELAPIKDYPLFVIDVSIIVPPEHSSTKYAVLISGGWTAQDAWPSFWNDLKFVYSVLVQNYYDPSNIYVIYNDGEGEDDQIPVDYSATPDNVNVVMDLLADVMTENDRLLFYVTDHGGQWGTSGAESSSDPTGLDEFICLWNQAGYYDDWLKTKLDAITCSRTIIIMDLCHAGGYTWDLSRTDRVIMTSSMEEQSSFDHPDVPNGDFTYNLFNAFVKYWWTFADMDGNGEISVAEAFNYAAATSISAQRPTYDDNGDGIAHYGDISNGGVVEDEGRLGDTYL